MNEPALAFRPRLVSASSNARAPFPSPIDGRALQIAEEAYRKVLALQPQHFRTLCSLATVRLQLGDADEARTLLERAADAAGDSAGLHLTVGKAFAGLGDLAKATSHFARAAALDDSSVEPRLLLGGALYGLGDPAAAVQHLQQALAIDATNADLHQALGLALQRLGQNEKAMSHHEAALAARPQFAAAASSLGDVCRQLGRHSEAIAHYTRALAIEPNMPMVLLNLGGCHQAIGELDAAIRNLQKALALSPQLAEAHYNLGNIHLDMKSWPGALFHYERAVALRPDFPEAHNNFANALESSGRHDEALSHYDEALRLRPDYAVAHRNRADSLRNAQRYDEAIAGYQTALAHDARDTTTMNHLAGVLTIVGRIDEAERAYESALAVNPRSIGTHLNLGVVKPFAVDDPRWPALQELASSSETLTEDARIALHFTLGRAYADIKDGERSLLHLNAGNGLERRRINYDENQALRQIERIRTVFSKQVLRARAGHGDPSDAPVFVIGMPRSGTSLIEQILASHPAVHGAGEVNYFAAAAGLFTDRSRGDYPEMLAKLADADISTLARAYLDRLTNLPPDTQRIVDKMPSNFLFAGLIHLALPNARIIHVRRNPIDTCLSCYTQLFAEPQPFAYDLAELGRYYRAYEQLMKHWRDVLPDGVMLEVAYEDVVRDFEAHARKIVAHSGLEWNDACLSFHENERPVNTASLVQVRKPLFSGSVGRWRMYGDRLKPLLDALGTEALRPTIAEAIAGGAPPQPVNVAPPVVTPTKDSRPFDATQLASLQTLADGVLAVAKKLQSRGEISDAEQIFKLILAGQPTNFEALVGLGMISTTYSRLEEAKDYFVRAVAVNANSAEAHGSIGAVEGSAGRYDEAVRHYETALTLSPSHPGILYGFAMVRQNQGLIDEAMALLRRAIDNKPQHLDAHFALGNLLYTSGKDIEAARHYLKVLDFSPEHAETHNNIANVLLRQGHRERAIEHYQRAIASRPDYADAYGNLGNAFLELNRLEESIEQNLLAIKIKPERFGSYNNLGVAYQALGRFDEATAAFQKALELAPDDAPIHLNLANMSKFKPDDSRLPGLQSLMARIDQLDQEKQIAAHFAFGKALSDLKDYDAAFSHLHKANTLKRQTFDYDSGQRLDMMKNVASRFTPEFFRTVAGHGDESWAPIFIVGMPRSGTTLMEQVLASHSKVFGAGELETFKDLVGECATRQKVVPNYPDLVMLLPPEEMTKLGQEYTARVRILAPEAERIVDKMPLNFLFVGLIHAAFPRARIINTRRDPLDNCISCYQLLFTGAQPFAYDLTELGHYYRGYEGVMEHWHKVLPPGVLIDVQYEDMVDDLEGVARRVLDHCGLDWEDACLDFHRTERTVRTASLMQVREPIYRRAIGSWRRYEKHLGPLRQALGLDEVPPAAEAT
ncbi:tetratricopeptide repeat-containing sulfotransferase family protein [Bradyrhizobium sp. ORS 285]|uniref:tetratricopeptide repeat-containing sulfotransferase family protein n=1 Tax=Bradyrhizobium sp. ORS 285 TaxID=115808 RepID=UPI000240944F|nr:tetratricopeptide repeat-containing sulfotransferase family protein [Bradyrhizobium sp. ORS 285]CCD83988.1 putative TPR repeat protein [Bradyrhizobium sp. ORS 285]